MVVKYLLVIFTFFKIITKTFEIDYSSYDFLILLHKFIEFIRVNSYKIYKNKQKIKLKWTKAPSFHMRNARCLMHSKDSEKRLRAAKRNLLTILAPFLRWSTTKSLKTRRPRRVQVCRQLTFAVLYGASYTACPEVHRIRCRKSAHLLYIQLLNCNITRCSVASSSASSPTSMASQRTSTSPGWAGSCSGSTLGRPKNN